MLCMGALGWLPRDWWSATLFDARMAAEGYDRARKDRLVELSMHAHWIIGHIRPAIWGKTFNAPTREQLYDPDFEKRAKSEEVQEDRKATLAKFPKTLEMK